MRRARTFFASGLTVAGTGTTLVTCAVPSASMKLVSLSGMGFDGFCAEARVKLITVSSSKDVFTPTAPFSAVCAEWPACRTRLRAKKFPARPPRPEHHALPALVLILPKGWSSRPLLLPVP